MSGVTLDQVIKRFGDVEVIHGVDLKIDDGEFCVFVGPSGCGKSTLLRMVAGLEETTEGAIHIGGRDVTREDPAERGVAMVFQTYALYPHLTVKGNMELGLKQDGAARDVIDRQVQNASEMLSLQDYLARRPAELSGGQRQRVAIGRAIVRDPKLFLFDEPLSNLDAALRVNTRLEIARLHRELTATMIYVTHDQVEAMTLADRIVVLNAGRIEQVGTPMELYHRPANAFVAGFIGSPQMNFIEAARIGVSGAATVGVRPEHLTVSAETGDWSGTVAHTERLGSDTNIYVDAGGIGMLTVRAFGDVADYAPGSPVYLRADPAQVHRFGADGARLD